MAWKGGKLTYVAIKSLVGSTLNVVSGSNKFSTATVAGKVYEFDGNLKVTNAPFDPLDIPAKIEAENYVAMDGVQIEEDSLGTPNIGWINDGDWTQYYINVPAAGSYVYEDYAPGRQAKAHVHVHWRRHLPWQRRLVQS